VVIDSGQLVEEEPNGVVARGAALAGDSGVEVMLHIEDVKGVLLPGLDSDGVTLRWPTTEGKPTVSGEQSRGEGSYEEVKWKWRTLPCAHARRDKAAMARGSMTTGGDRR
jgi:hypothetical protein